MGRMIDDSLNRLFEMLLRMGRISCQAVSKAIDESLNGGYAYDEIYQLSETLFSISNTIDDKSFELIARFQPVASDLRTIKSYMKIAYDFARFGRYALDISYINKKLGGLNECGDWIKSYVKEMSEKTLSTVSLSIDSLKNRDAELAKKVSKIEKEVDEMYFAFLEKLAADNLVEKRCIISSVLIVRYLERIADHASYACESIIYIATGRRTVLR